MHWPIILEESIPTNHIKQSIETAIAYLTSHPDEARYTDSAAVATLEAGLRFRVTDADGRAILTDMPKGVGGEGKEPSPGWLALLRNAGEIYRASPGTILQIDLRSMG